MLKLNRETIQRANGCSQYDAGDVLAREAESVHAEGVQRMQDAYTGEALTERRAEILAERLAAWDELVTKAYNDIIRRRASWMPWTVCGPANYNGRRNNARADAQMRASSEWSEKMDHFIMNTINMMRDALPLAGILEEYRTGRRSDPIESDDPAAPEKLAARLEYLKAEHAAGLAANAYYRKHKTLAGFTGWPAARVEKTNEFLQRVPCSVPYFNDNGAANIRRLEQRRAEILRHQEQAAAQPEQPAADTAHGFTARRDAGRIYIEFAEKPSEEARGILKGNAFHWSPRAAAWTRVLTAGAESALRRVLDALRALPEYAAEPEQPAQPAPEALSLAAFADRFARAE